MPRISSSVPSSPTPTLTIISSTSGRTDRMAATTGYPSLTALRTKVKPETLTSVLPRRRAPVLSHPGRPGQPPQLPHSSARSGSAPGRFRSFHSTISQPRRRATSRKGALGFTTIGFPTASKSGTSAIESE